jgi:hypothetical protein
MATMTYKSAIAMHSLHMKFAPFSRVNDGDAAIAGGHAL